MGRVDLVTGRAGGGDRLEVVAGPEWSGHKGGVLRERCPFPLKGQGSPGSSLEVGQEEDPQMLMEEAA